MTHELLTGDGDPPNDWEDGWISGKYISFRRPIGDDKYRCVVIEQGGEYGDGKESRPVEVWTVDLPQDMILMNWKSEGETIGEGVGLTEGAEIALEYMESDN